MIHCVCTGVIYPEFRSRTPPPTYSATVLEYEDRRRPRRLSCDDVEMFPSISTSVDVEPVPATPPPAYRGRHSTVYCPRALRCRPLGFVANDSIRPAANGSSSTSSSEICVVGKRMSGVEHGIVATSSLKPEPSTGEVVSDSCSTDDCRVASCSSNSS